MTRTHNRGRDGTTKKEYREQLAAKDKEIGRLQEKARLFELEIREAEEALLGLEVEKATEIIEKALKGKENG